MLIVQHVQATCETLHNSAEAAKVAIGFSDLRPEPQIPSAVRNTLGTLRLAERRPNTDNSNHHEKDLLQNRSQLLGYL